MLKMIIGLVGIFLLIGCGGRTNNSPGPNDDFGKPPTASVYKREIRKHFDTTLKDPYSAKYIYQTPVRAYSNLAISGYNHYWQGWAVFVSVNAKNSYGGYIGSQTYAILFRGNKAYTFFEQKDLHLVKLVQ